MEQLLAPLPLIVVQLAQLKVFCTVDDTVDPDGVHVWVHDTIPVAELQIAPVRVSTGVRGATIGICIDAGVHCTPFAIG